MNNRRRQPLSVALFTVLMASCGTPDPATDTAQDASFDAAPMSDTPAEPEPEPDPRDVPETQDDAEPPMDVMDPLPENDVPTPEPDAPDVPLPEPEDNCDFFANPALENNSGDGTQQRPWGSLAMLAALGRLPSEGGALCLMDGHHGRPHLRNVQPTTPLVIRALNPRLAVIDALILSDSDNIVFEGLVVDGTHTIDPNADERGQFLVSADPDSASITLRGLVVQSADSSEDWGWDDWRTKVKSGVDLRGPDATVESSTIKNTYHALSLRADGATVTGNLIDNFGGDGIRGLGSNSTYAWNTVRDAYIDEYEVQHDDAFQAYELEGDLKISNVHIHHNRFILFADPITERVIQEELVGTLMQGIIITDGYAEGWVVENNLVLNSQPHGISLFGARQCRIQNNTVVRHPAFEATAGPWIRIADQTKTGQTNHDNIIRNNLTTMLTPWDYDPTSTVEHNLQITDPAAHFANIAAYDLRLRPDSPALDQGRAQDLTDVDLDGAPRLVGPGVDLGAFESQAVD